MKFARDYQEALERDEYPAEWVKSAISYKKLKKCIKRVQEELQSLGLDHATLEKLWQHGSIATPVHKREGAERGMQYKISGNSNVDFVPKLTIALDPKDGSPMDAWLSPDTRRVLRAYSRRKSSVVTLPDHSSDASHHVDDSNEHGEEVSEHHEDKASEAPETIEIPLTSDSEFFQILRRELADLEQLQENERRHLEGEIVKLSENLRAVKAHHNKKSREELEAWREIFRLYADAEVFFSSHELDAGSRDATHAQTQMAVFNKALSSVQGKSLKLTPKGTAALERFLRINFELLKFLKYQEINKVALTKIMKKFDKQTSLRAKDNALVQINRTPFMAQDLAKATCFTISDELLKIIPQMDDYTCPVCFSISWRPIRLRCGHVFCIRCLIVMQRASQDDCPLCREHVVLEATSDNVDHDLSKFLKQNFRKEVKDKQRENEIAAGVDQFGEEFNGTHRCAVM